VAFSARRLGWSGDTIFSPDAIQTVDRPVKETVVGNGRYFASVDASGDWSSYAATALVERAAQPGSADGFTVNNLRAASTDYSLEIRETYIRRAPTGTLGLYAQRLLADIVKAAGTGNNPYDMAMAAVSILHDPTRFQYDTDITDLAAPCSQLSTVECFAEYHRGYCQYFATTMAVLLRELGIPTRFVQGWLPGGRDPKTGIETVLMSNSHAWVEVYFPGYGWHMFDPTGNGLSQTPTLPEGPKVSPTPIPSTKPRATGGDTGPDRTIRPPANGAGGTTGTPSSPSGALLVVVAIVLIGLVGLLAFLAYRRGPRGPTQVETAWSGLTRLAGRFGWAPRPTQTPFEYAGALGEILPVARADLHVVASAKVEVAYGRKILDAERLSMVRTAQRKLRVTLLRLVFRRPKRGPRVRGR
jgi:transglutaminase-like putative cysteine protease